MHPTHEILTYVFQDDTGDYEWIREKMKENNKYKKFIGKRK